MPILNLPGQVGPSGGASLVQVQDIIKDALLEIGSYSPGEDLAAEDAFHTAFAAELFLDEWAADRQFVYSTSFQVFTLMPSLSPHTIGPANATFQQSQRPVDIKSASIIPQLGGKSGRPAD